MTPPNLQFALVFSTDDQAWIRREHITVPAFFDGHAVAPARDDVLRIAGRQFVVQARVWEHDGERPLLRLYLGTAQAHSDTVFG